MSSLGALIVIKFTEAVAGLLNLAVEQGLNAAAQAGAPEDPRDAFDDLYRKGTACLMASDPTGAASLFADALAIAEAHDLDDRALAAGQSLYLARH